MSEENNKKSLFDSMSEFNEIQEQVEKEYDEDAEDFWNSLSKDDQLKAFYSVVKRLHDGEIVKGGSYRYVLYDIFGFGLESYMIGHAAGYLELHNHILSDKEYREYLDYWYEKRGSKQV